MADYGLIVRNRLGHITFGPGTYAARGVVIFTVAASGSRTDDILLRGIPWASWYSTYFEFPRPCNISFSGNRIIYDLPTAGLKPAQISASVTIIYGIR